MRLRTIYSAALPNLSCALLLVGLLMFSSEAEAQTYEITTTGYSQTFPGTLVLVSSPTSAQQTRLSYAGITGYWISDGVNYSEEITFTFVPPATRVIIPVTATSNVGGNTEEFEFDINGVHHNVTAVELDNSTPAGGIDFYITGLNNSLALP